MERFKLGFPNPRGWLAYWRKGTLFIKRAAYFAQESYCDFGCSSECYMNEILVELETLSPMRKLEARRVHNPCGNLGIASGY